MRIIVFKTKPKTNQGSHRTSNTMSAFPLNHHNFSADVRNYLKRKAGEAGYKIEKFQVNERENADFDVEKYKLYKRMSWVISFVRKTYSTKEEMFAAILEDHDYDWFKTHIQKKPKREVEKPKRRETKTIHQMPKHCTGETGSEEARCYWRMKLAEKQIQSGQAEKEDFDEYWYKRSKNGNMSRRERTLCYEKNGIGRDPYQHDWPLPPPPPEMLSGSETSGSETDEYTKSILPDLDTLVLPPPPADFWDK